MTFHTLKLEFERKLATLTLNRPEKRNAISTEMIDEILSALGEIEASPVRVAILTGAGKAFSAGMDIEDLKRIATQSPEQHWEDSRRMARLFHRVYHFPKPLIAAVNGAAIAGGTGLATLADFTLAVPEAKFGYTEARIGFVPGIVSVFLVRQVGEKRARDLLLTGRLFEAEEARQMGLVNEVVPAEKLIAHARVVADTLITNSPGSLDRTKKLLLAYSAPELERDLELAIQENARIRSTEDFEEGVSAFLEKRKPRWTGN